MPHLSIIIPTLQEAGHLGQLLTAIAESEDVDVEVIVTDGGSTDGTRAVARAHRAVVVEGPSGRGAQLNRGWKVAAAPLLLFLHADSRLTARRQLVDALAAYRAAEESSEVPVAGHFQLRFFDATGSAFTYYEGLSALGRAQTVNGDQGLLISAAWLRQLGGFHETMPFLEDQALGARIFAEGRWVCLPGRLETSARRFLVEGLAERSIHNAVTVAMFTIGHRRFLEDAPARYRTQNTCGNLRVAPLAREVWSMVRTSPELWVRLGGYTNRHGLWRAAFWLDVRRYGHEAAQHHPMLRFYDRCVAPWTHNAVGDRLCILPMLATFGAVWRVYARRERLARQSGSSTVAS